VSRSRLAPLLQGESDVALPTVGAAQAATATPRLRRKLAPGSPLRPEAAGFHPQRESRMRNLPHAVQRHPLRRQRGGARAAATDPAQADAV